MLKSQWHLNRVVSAGLILVVGLGLALAFGQQDSRALSTLPQGHVLPISGQPASSHLVAVIHGTTANNPITLYQSRDEGVSWEATGTLPWASVQALAMSPANPDVLAAASADQVMRSDDGGQTWSELTLDFAALNAADAQVKTLAMDGRVATHLYLGTNEGLFEFDGQTLTRSTDDALGSTSIAALLTSNGNLGAIYAATPRGLYAQTGDGWTRIAGVAAPVSQLLESSGILIAATGSSGLYRSIDSGRTWAIVPEQPDAQPGVTVDVTALTADVTRPGVLYAATGFWFGTTERHFTPGALFVSLDHGSRWQPLVDADGQTVTVPARVDRLLPSTTPGLSVQALTDRGAIEARLGSIQDQLRRLNSADPGDRTSAATALGWLGDTGAAPALLAHLDDADAATGLAVVAALGRLGDQRVVPALLEQLDAPDTAVTGIPGTVRMRAAMALGLLRAEAAVTPLADIMINDETIARQAAAEALARIGTSAAAEALARPLMADALSPARQAAMRGLEQMGAAATPALEQIMRTESTATARRNAAEVLGWIAAPGSTPYLVSALEDSDADVRAEAAWALGEISSPAAREALQAVARNDVSPAVRAAAELALSRQPVDAQTATVTSSEPVSLSAQLADFLAPPRGLILLVSALLAALVLWLRPGIATVGHRVRHN